MQNIGRLKNLQGVLRNIISQSNNLKTSRLNNLKFKKINVKSNLKFIVWCVKGFSFLMKKKKQEEEKH